MLQKNQATEKPVPMHNRQFFLFVAAVLLAGLPWSRGAAPNDAVARAMAGVDEGVARAEADPTRPTYHFRAPARWMNDPNGPIYHQGYYHLFYQLNPYADDWGHMHWGHARSRDLVRWQHLPVALWPSEEQGEEHVFSGCATTTTKGQPLIFYTSIAKGKSAETHAEQWAAIGDKDLMRWQKHPKNPILTEALHGTTKVYDWRDPFVFQHRGVTYLVLGGNLNERKGGQAVVTLYRAEDPGLTQWKYLGVLFTHPNPKVVNIECPNFFKLEDRWVLIVSPHGPVEYFLGDFDVPNAKFNVRQSGTLDVSGSYYAPNSLVDFRGRRVMWGWVRGFQGGRGWNGCLSLPRVLSLDSNDGLLQKPAQELKKLRTDHFRLADAELNPEVHEIAGLRGDCLEIYAELELYKAAAVQLQLRRSEDGTRSVPITFDGAQLDVAGEKVPIQIQPGHKTLKLHLFLDKSTLELFVDDRAAMTRVLYPPENDLGVALSAAAGVARVRSFHAWKMRPIW